MSTHQRTAAIGLIAWSLLAMATTALAQPPQPKPAAAKPPRPAPVAASTQPVKATGTDTEPLPPSLETDPAVRSALQTPRKEPRDFVRAILWLIDLGKPELAKPILAELTKLNVSDAQRVAIVAEFGSQGMLHLARTKELAPEGAAFAEACMNAASIAANNPQRIAALVTQLTDLSPEVRTIARNDLAATGQIGVTATLEALARENDRQRRAALITAAELMHPLVDGPLLAMLETSDPRLRADVAALLQRLAVPQAAPLLPANSTAPGLSLSKSAERALASALADYKHGTPPFAADDNNQVELWKWNDVAKKLSSARVPAYDAQIVWIARLAGELARIRPDNLNDQQNALVLRLESDGLTSGTATGVRPINPAALAQADQKVLSVALADALEADYSHAALALVEALALRRDPGILMSAAGKSSPLTDALDSPNRRVRYAALKAIMAIDPPTPYPGSSRVPDALTWFASTTGEHQAVVAMPTLAAASNLAGQLAAHQLVTEATNRGHDAVALARAMPDLELILIDMNILAPEIRQVVYELRISPTTGEVPIALLAADGRLEAAQRVAADHTRVIAVSRPHTAEALASIVEDLAKLAARDQLPVEERMAQAAQAQKWLGALTAGNRPFYTFRRTAMLAPATIAPRPHAKAPAPESLPAP